MTGNNKVWRAPLAGLASVAMLATMGVAAGTASAATAWPFETVKVSDAASYQVEYGESLADTYFSTFTDTFAPAAKSGYTFVGFKGVDGLTSAITKDTTLESVYAETATRVVPVTVSYGGKHLFFNENGVQVANAGSYTFYAETNKNLSNLFKPVDLAGDGYVATSYKFTGTTAGGKNVDLGTVSDFSKVNAQNYTSIKAEPADASKTAKLVSFDYTGTPDVKLTGAVADGDSSMTKLNFDVAKGGSVTAPTFVSNPDADKVEIPGSWKNKGDDTDVKDAGAKIEVNDDLAYEASNKTVTVPVKYADGLGNIVETEYIKLDKTDENGAKYGFANGTEKLPTREGYIFNGWEVEFADHTTTTLTTTDPTTGFDNFPIRRAVTFTARWEQSSDIAVTFRDAVYKGSHDDVTVKVPTGKVWDGSNAPTWNDRPGYVFVGWSTVKSDDSLQNEYKFGQLIESDQPAFVLYAQYAQVDEDTVKTALNYVNDGTKIGRDNISGNDNSDLFTESSFAEFKKTWTKVNDAYKEAQYAAQDNKISAATATDLVKQLNDAWKKLVFTNVDETTGQTKVVESFRFFNKVNGEHLFTTDRKEVNALKADSSWTYEGKAFGSLAKDKKIEKLAKFGNDKLAAVADPIVTGVYRLFNRANGEHLFTTDENEYDILQSRNWSAEGAVFFAPVYSSTKNVYRLFDPAKGQHLFTLDANEAQILSAKRGWSNEGVVFKAL